MSPSQHLQNWGVVDDGRKEGSLQERSCSHVAVSVPHWHLVPPAVRTAWPKAGVVLPVLIEYRQLLITHGTGTTAQNDLIQGRRKKAEWE